VSGFRHWGRIPAHISDADRLRNRARRLAKVASRSRREGRPEYLVLLTQVVTEILELARESKKRQRGEQIGASDGDVAETLGRMLHRV
jgi:hypothetical protein